MAMKVLVVDDSRLARFSLIKLLKEYDSNVEIFEGENGAVAVELYQANLPDLVFLDLTMPVMDGFEALKRIMQDKSAKVIVVSADIQVQAQEQVLADGALMMIPKPINADKMTAILNQTIK